MPQCNIKKPLQRPLALFSQSLGPGPVWTQITLDKLQISVWSHVNKVAHVVHIIYICLCYSIYDQQVSCFSTITTENNRACYVTCMGKLIEKCYQRLLIKCFCVSDLLYVSKTVIMKLVDKLIKDYDPAVKVNINKNDQSLPSLCYS